MRRVILFAFFFSLIAACSDDTGSNVNNTTSNNSNNTTNNDVDAGTDTGCLPGDRSCIEDPCAAMDCGTNQICAVQGGAAQCVCAGGTHMEAGVCVEDTLCMEGTCAGRGTCTDGADGLSCVCDAGFTGEFCDACAAGFQADGVGGCTDDLCSLIECVDRECRVDNGVAVCTCAAGTHDEAGTCVPDTTCTSDSCGGNGTCAEANNGVTCTCEAGWELPACAQCDSAAGYHDDGAGGCTMDVCTPNPCTGANQTQCSTDNDMPLCLCDPGFHDNAGTCVVDQTCGANSCSGNGTCSDTAGVIVCACSAGFEGDNCSACDVAAGYHSDGAGGCTMDICLPNPCTLTPNKTTCVDNGAGAFACECATGFHADGMGGCTTDPCTPNLCAAMNQACRVTNNAAECYVPDCDDDNSCTVDTRVNGVCQHTPATNGTTCSTSACLTGESCQSGTCGGGAALVCNDNNACTDDTCAPATGCVFTNDNTNIPSDGVGCTVDACADGFESHTASNAICDNGLFCDGTEICAPGMGANVQGCITQNVPVAPANPSPCQVYGACNEATDAFPLTTLTAGASCNDGVYCTNNDVCSAAGICAGTATAACNAASFTCTTTHPFSGSIDIPDAPLTVNLTLNGAPFPATGDDNTTHLIYAVAKDTGVRHLISSFYWYSTGMYRNDATRLMPGMYDILYRKGETSTDSGYVYKTEATDMGPNGVRYLAKDILFTGGSITLDIPDAPLTVSLTLDGAPFPATGDDNTTHLIYAVAKDTGVRHLISSFYWYSTGMYRNDATRLMPGTYDILYRKGETSTDSGYVYKTEASDIGPNGVRYLAKDIVFTGGNISLDIPDAPLTVSLTLEGAPFPATGDDNTTHLIYAVARDTGVRHLISSFYWYSTGMYRNDATRLMPGTYDILYRKGETSTDSGYVYKTEASDIGPNGVRYLAKGIVFTGGNISLDIPDAPLTVNLTLDGAPFPATGDDNTTHLVYAVAKDTGARHLISSFYWYSTGMYRNDATRLMPGTYDILYRKGETSTDSGYVYKTEASDMGPNGVRYLARDVVFTGGSLSIDIPDSPLMMNITLRGAPFAPTGDDNTTHLIYAVARDTDVRHLLSSFYWYSTGMYRNDATRLMPGTYDILYRKGETSTDSGYVYKTEASDMGPNGVRYLDRCVTFQ